MTLNSIQTEAEKNNSTKHKKLRPNETYRLFLRCGVDVLFHDGLLVLLCDGCSVVFGHMSVEASNLLEHARAFDTWVLVDTRVDAFNV